MIRCVVQVRLDGDLLAGLVSRVAAAMSVLEIVKHRTPCLGIALLICETADGPGDHAVNRSLDVVGVSPPGARSIPGHTAGSCAQVTRPGTTPRGTSSGESVDPSHSKYFVSAVHPSLRQRPIHRNRGA